MAKEEILDDLFVNHLMDGWMCDVVEDSTLFNIVEHQLAQGNSIDLSIW